MRTRVGPAWLWLLLTSVALLVAAGLRGRVPSPPPENKGSPAPRLEPERPIDSVAAADQAEEARLLTERLGREPERGPIRCRVSRAGEDTAEIALVNVSGRDHEFRFTVFEMKEHVTMLLRRPSGEVAASIHWAVLSSSTTERRLVLPAGQAERHVVHPSSVVFCHHGAKLADGPYDFQAFFSYGGCFSLSERIPVEVRGEKVLVPAR